MHTLQLKLITTEYEKQIINKRFYAMCKIHNVCVKHAMKLLTRLNCNKEYQQYLTEYKSLLKKEKLSATDKKRKTELSKLMTQIRNEIGLSECAFKGYLKVIGKRYRHLVSSRQVQKEATRVWKGVEAVLFGNGKHLHFKKANDILTISENSNDNGAKFNKETLSVEWLGLQLKCKTPKDMLYITESLNHDICYCEIKRMMFNNGWHYYVIVYLKGNPPAKLKETGTSTMGIDPGVSTVAAVSETTAVLTELAPDIKKYNKQIIKLQEHIDNSRRINNPNKFNQDGTIKKGNRDPWIKTKSYKKALRQLRTLYRKKSSYIKQHHETLCNQLIADSGTFIVEDMNFKALAKRSKKTERQTKPSVVNGKEVFKYKKKKRYGKSLNNRSPALFLVILERKCNQYGLQFHKINTRKFKASQYNHVTDTCMETHINDRSKQIGNVEIQRDLYSAFLIRNTDATFEKSDRDLCFLQFDNFVQLHNNLIADMKTNKVTMKQCFGF